MTFCSDLPDLEPAEEAYLLILAYSHIVLHISASIHMYVIFHMRFAEELAVHTLVRESSLRDDGEPPPGRDAGLETEPQSSPPASPPESPLLGPASPEMSPSPEILTLPLPKAGIFFGRAELQMTTSGDR